MRHSALVSPLRLQKKKNDKDSRSLLQGYGHLETIAGAGGLKFGLL
jgi:hypothetical protein